MKNDEVIHVAYAECFKVFRKGLITLLNSMEGIEVNIDTDNGKELIEKIEKTKDVPDICIIDINLKDMDGFDTVVELKKRWPEMGVLIFTGFNYELYITRMLLNGANGYLLKTCEVEEIKKAIVDIYRNGIYFSELLSRKILRAIQNHTMKMPNFTAREIETLKYCCSDMSYAQIALKLGTTTRSVEGYRDSLFKKLNVNSRVSLALYAVKYGLVVLETKSTEEVRVST
jgi:DNA-binding NarL/FixJ family response regulator